MMRLSIFAVALSLVGVLAAEPAVRPTQRSFSGTETSSVYVTMRDGVRLAVDVHLPKGLAPGERTATILHMSRYYRSVDVRGPLLLFLGRLYPVTERDIREPLVKAGYSWVDVDVRGAGASFGHREYPPSAEEVRDGAEILDWIVAQPWSAGVVGTTGVSYDGALASLLMRNHHPALQAVVPRFSGWDAYGDIFVPGGVPATPLLRDWAHLTDAFDQGRLSDIFGWTVSMITGGVRPVDARVLPQAMAEHARNVDIVPLIGSVVYRDDHDPRGPAATMDDFSPHTSADGAADVPVYAYAGWFDAALPRGAVHQYLANHNPGSRLRLGPWFHGGEFNASPYANGHDNNFDHARELIRFYDYHLRGMDNGVGGEAPVQYYTMGEERWKAAGSWPPPGAITQTLFFAADHVLSQQPARMESASDTYQVDKTTTSGPGSRWGLIVGTGIKRGYPDRREADRRLLTYTTAPLREDVEVTGHPIVRLSLSASVTDGAVFAYLEDVQPGGAVRYVTEGELRLVHRKLGTSSIPRDPVPFHSYLREDGRPLVPGEIADVVFDLLPTSFLFRAGHAIRLAIAGADAGSLDAPLPGSPLIYEIHRDQLHPSRVDLPTYPRVGHAKS